MVILNLSIGTIIGTMDTDSFIVHIKTEDVCKDIEDDVGKRFAISNYGMGKALLKSKNKKLVGLMKDYLGGKIVA